MNSRISVRRMALKGGVLATLTMSLFFVASCKKDEVNVSATISGFSPSSGVVGSIVIITGANFSTVLSSNHVTFNGTGAVVSAASVGQLTATVPSGATTGKISVSNGSGAAATSSSNFTVTQ